MRDRQIGRAVEKSNDPKILDPIICATDKSDEPKILDLFAILITKEAFTVRTRNIRV